MSAAEGLAALPVTTAVGRVRAVRGLALHGTLPGVRLGQVIEVRGVRAVVTGFADDGFVAMPLGDLAGLGPDDDVRVTASALETPVGEALRGRVVDALGRPLDGGGPLERAETRPLDAAPPPALSRRAVTRPFETGVRVIDAMLTLGEGQRVGLFAGSGVGKSTLLARLARTAFADVVVVALVGERGREARDFVLRDLGPARDRAVVVVSTSDEPPMMRLSAALAATSIAEAFRDRGLRVLLLVDSLTRVARAQRDLGLASGEAPARRGFPPSVLTLLPRLTERAGQAERGSITAVYTVLVEGGDLDEPISDEARGTLDGHLVLSRTLADRGVFPAVDVVQSVSRVMDVVAEPEDRAAAAVVRARVALFEGKRDLVELGAHARGADAKLAKAIDAQPAFEAFVRQGPEAVSRDDALRALRGLAGG